jgi:hypothetical protein
MTSSIQPVPSTQPPSTQGLGIRLPGTQLQATRAQASQLQATPVQATPVPGAQVQGTLLHGTLLHGTEPTSGLLTGAWPRGWRAVAGLTSVAAGAAIIAGAFLPWVEIFAGLMPLSGVRGTNGRILAAAGAVIICAGLYQLARGGQRARWTAGLVGFAALAFSGYLLIQLTRSMRVLGGDSMVAARGGPGLWVAAVGSLAAFVTLFLPPSTQATLRRDARRPLLASLADRQSAGLRRGLQVALGLVWLLDAALEFQPYMFSKAFPATVLAPSAMGQPAFVSGPVLAMTHLISGQVVAWNALFATIQLALAAGLFWRPAVRAALIGTVVWSLSVWWLGEGLGMVFSRMANPLTGAPGGAVLYAFLAVLAWPAVQERRGASVADGSPLGRWARAAWFVLWAVMAAEILLAPAGSASLTAPGGIQATIVAAGFAAAFAAVAVGVFLPATVRPALVLAAVAAVALWVTGEDFGALLSGSATDPNTGPLLVLLAVAFWPSAAPLARPRGLVARSVLGRMTCSDVASLSP